MSIRYLAAVLIVVSTLFASCARRQVSPPTYVLSGTYGVESGK